MRSGPGAARTILLFRIISARPPKQPLFFSPRGLGRRMHLGVEVTESSTNEQHHLISPPSHPPIPPPTHPQGPTSGSHDQSSPCFNSCCLDNPNISLSDPGRYPRRFHRGVPLAHFLQRVCEKMCMFEFPVTPVTLRNCTPTRFSLNPRP